MTSSIYHFFSDLEKNKRIFNQVRRLEDFPFDPALLSYRNPNVFPGIAIRLNNSPNRRDFTGGELVETLDSRGYTLPAFNHVSPSGKKDIAGVIAGKNGQILKEMEAAGDQVFSLPVRDTFYLLRGSKAGQMKVCLVHGSFLESFRASGEFMRKTYYRMLKRKIVEGNLNVAEDTKGKLLEIFSDPQRFHRLQKIPLLSMKLRLHIVMESRKLSNIMDSERYPLITGDSLNFVLPCHDEQDERQIKRKMTLAFDQKQLQELESFTIEHPFNGRFAVFQAQMTS